MQITEHTYRMPILRSIVVVSIGALVAVCSLISLILLPAVWSFLTELNNVAGQLFVLAVYLIFALFFLDAGVLSILRHLFTRLIVTSDGLEYQTFFGNMKSAWADLYRMEYPNLTNQYGPIVLASRKPLVRLHRWTRIVPWNIEKKFIARGIHLSQFGKLSGSPLEADLYNFAPNLKESLQTRQPQILTIVCSFLVVTLFFFVIIGQSATLSCERAAHRMQVDCSIRRSWYWIVPLGRSEVQNVRGSKIVEYSDSEGSYYQIVLETAKGNRPLYWLPALWIYQDNKSTQAIDEFVNNPAHTRFEARIGPPEIIQTVFGILVVVTVLSGIWLFWHGREKVKSGYFDF